MTTDVVGMAVGRLCGWVRSRCGGSNDSEFEGMKIGLIDVDGHNYPNLPLMKISAWHKGQGDQVEWYEPLIGGHYDKVYMSKVFSFTEDYLYPINADEIVKGGSGYCIRLEDGKEVFDKKQDKPLPPPIEHIYPDYGLYSITDRAYGFLSRGCPRGCSFCHVATKEGQRAYKVADLSEFWRGQPHIDLLDPNILACAEWQDLLKQLIESKAKVNFNQGLDIRVMTEAKAEMLSEIPTEAIHFAWDRYEDKDMIVPKFKTFMERTNYPSHSVQVYVLCGFDTTIEQDLDRIYTLRDMGYAPYVMIYNKDSLPRRHKLRQLQRWVNARNIFYALERFEDYTG